MKAHKVLYMESELSINLSSFAAALNFMSLFTVTKRLKYFSLDIFRERRRN